jgi:hypothetical protein
MMSFEVRRTRGALVSTKELSFGAAFTVLGRLIFLVMQSIRIPLFLENSALLTFHSLLIGLFNPELLSLEYIKFMKNEEFFEGFVIIEKEPQIWKHHLQIFLWEVTGKHVVDILDLGYFFEAATRTLTGQDHLIALAHLALGSTFCILVAPLLLFPSRVDKINLKLVIFLMLGMIFASRPFNEPLE